MKKQQSKTPHVFKNILGVADKGILKRNLLGFIMMICVISAGIFMQSCGRYDILDNVPENSKNAADLEVADFKNWFKSQDISSEFVGTQKPDWDNAEVKIAPDGKSSHVSIEIYKSKNVSGNDSIRELHIAYVKTGFKGGVRVLSFYKSEYANTQYYSLTGRILEEGKYYAPKQVYILLKRHNVGYSPVRLKNGTETDACNDNQEEPNSETPLEIDGEPNGEAYNCHYYVWGAQSESDCLNLFPGSPNWIICPDIANSGYEELPPGEVPQPGDKWVSYDHVGPPFNKTMAIHSANIEGVTNGKITKLKSKDAEGSLWTYNPACPIFAPYNTGTIKYYRKVAN